MDEKTGKCRQNHLVLQPYSEFTRLLSTVIHMTTARQRLGKHVPEFTSE
jgi:hypothetical protein